MRSIFRKFIFTKELVNIFAPDFEGFYVLINYSKEIIYIGKSDQSIKKSLMDHLSGLKGRNTRAAFYFSTEIEFHPAKRVEEILSDYYRFFGKIPECNKMSLSFH
jgi:thioredoxin-related protein